jgi:LacI family transcriptional regulator
MEDNKAKPTIEDVAKYCGVSISTVSRVINKSTPVSKELNRKVRKAIKELEFTPRQWTARTSTDTIVLVIPDILNPSYAEVINGAQEEADRQGLNLVLLNVTENPRLQKQHLDLLRKIDFDGLIVMGTVLRSKFLIELHERYNIPVIVSRSTEIPQLPCVMIDVKTAACQATKYLLSLNHKRIAYIAGPPNWSSSKIRLEQIQNTLSEAGLTLPSHLYRWCFPNIEEGFQAVNSILTLPKKERPTAIIGFHDLIAIGALRAMYIAGLRVPQDISVIGFDDIAIAAYTTPSLTTVAQPKYRIGQLSVKKLYGLIHGDVQDNQGVTMLECPLIVRESTAPCPE